MSIALECKECGTKLKAPDRAIGKKVRCPKCQSSVPVVALHDTTSETEEVVDEQSESEEEEAPQRAPTQQKKPSNQSGEQMKRQAGEIGKKAYSKAREATGNAIAAIKILVSDPMGGQAKALEGLGESKSLQAGVIFILVFIAAAYWMITPLFEFLGGPGGPDVSSSLPLEMKIKLCVVCAIPALALSLASFGVGKLFGGTTGLFETVFSTGVALLPAAVVLVATRLLGLGNIELVCTLLGFAICTIILLMNAVLLDVHRLSTQKAFLLTPAMILLAAYVSKVIFVALIHP